MSDTPRTDRQKGVWSCDPFGSEYENEDAVDREYARQLERECNQWKTEAERWRKVGWQPIETPSQ